ncbi:MAG: GvpL/GvpF family gas vesicle protein [Cyclobacteriaceae bacterium]
MDGVFYLYGLIESKEKAKIDELNYLCSPVGQLHAIYSVEDIDEFGVSAFQENIKNIPWLEDKVIKHNHILTMVASKVAVIPIKFGSVYSSELAMQNVLSEEHDKFLEQLRKIGSRQEWGLKLNYHNQQLTEYLLENDHMLVEQSNLSRNGTPGQRFLAKKKIDTELKAVMKREINSLREMLYKNVNSKSEQIKVLQNTANELSEKGWVNVLNLAMLVERMEPLEIGNIIDDRKINYDKIGFKIELTGPWPAYNFVENE